MQYKYLWRGPLRGRVLLYAICGATLWSSQPSWAQQLAPAPVAQAAAPGAGEAAASPTLDQAALEQEAPLQAKVSLEARRMPLRDLLTEVQKQSGIKISPVEAPVLKSLVTARVHEMTLAKVMGALSRIYDVRWSKQGEGYAMRPTDKDALSYQLLREHGIDWQFPTVSVEAEKERRSDALAAEIYHSVDEEAWKLPGGVPALSLPQEMQQKLYDLFKELGDNGDIGMERAERTLAEHKLVLRLHVPEFNPDPKGSPPPLTSGSAAGVQYAAARDKQARIVVYTTDGRVASVIFPSFHTPQRPLPPPPPPPRPPANAPPIEPPEDQLPPTPPLEPLPPIST